MKAILDASRAALVTTLLTLAVAACDRTATDRTSGDANAPPAPGNGMSGSALPDASGSRSSAGARIDDSIITAKVKTVLKADADIKGADIGVETAQGEVLLSGFAESSGQIAKAVTIAHAVDGVKRVENKMAVRK